jgi:hypothetical protein
MLPTLHSDSQPCNASADHATAILIVFLIVTKALPLPDPGAPIDAQQPLLTLPEGHLHIPHSPSPHSKRGFPHVSRQALIDSLPIVPAGSAV